MNFHSRFRLICESFFILGGQAKLLKHLNTAITS